VKTPIIDDILATHEKGFDFRGWVEMDKLATELRAVLADRERLANERADAIRMARDLCGGGAFLDSLHLADVIEKHVFRAGQAESVTTPIPPRRLREYKGVTYRDGAWFLGIECSSNVYRALSEFITMPTEADHAALLALRDDPEEPVETLESIAHLATQPQPITPEQAVAVLVAHGARRSTAWNSVIATGGGNDAVLILPTATPESGK
jgi:hypothetical protein